MKALLLIAHGSRREASNDEIRAVTAKLAVAAGNRFDHVQCGFLELAEPSIPDGIEECIDAGATAIVVMPYFLAAGRHVEKDIPALVQSKVEQHPDVAINISTYLGASAQIPQLLLSLLED